MSNKQFKKIYEETRVVFWITGVVLVISCFCNCELAIFLSLLMLFSMAGVYIFAKLLKENNQQE